ncbi:unannotated protein [freshwater metagenome]|uniref:Unannotated protein n=1 Tax=freshwater metagenome TaxID=449393 RepID=A0A6J6MHI1_9ZZZZ
MKFLPILLSRLFLDRAFSKLWLTLKYYSLIRDIHCKIYDIATFLTPETFPYIGLIILVVEWFLLIANSWIAHVFRLRFLRNL